MYFAFKSYDFVDYLICILDKIQDTKHIEQYRKIMQQVKIIKKY